MAHHVTTRTFSFGVGALKHVGKQPLKFEYDLYVCDVRGLPSDVSKVAVSWDRGGKQQTASRHVSTQTTGSDERTAMIDETLRQSATLYRSSKRATFDAKPSAIRILDVSGGPYAPPTVLGLADFDLAEHADLNADAPPRSKQLHLPRLSFRRDDANPDMQILIQMTVTSRWLQNPADSAAASSASGRASAGGGGVYPGVRETTNHSSAGSDASSSHGGGGSSMASSALTHDALQQFEASHGRAGPPSAALSNSEGGGGHYGGHYRSVTSSGKGKAESSRVAELSQLMAGAAADARQAESRLATLQFRLRTEVIESVETSLQTAAGLKKSDEQAKAYHKLLIHTLDQVQRIASDDGGSLRGGGGVAPLEAEVLQLRRELADSKVEVARLQGEREELDHVARRLNKQLTEVATARPRRSIRD